MIYLLKQYFREWSGNLFKEEMIQLSEKGFELFQEEHELCTENEWYGETDLSGYDEDHYYVIYKKIMTTFDL